MANSLLTGISGLRGHQKMLEVVGNNLANLNTTSFKASRVLFSDLMYEVQRGASSTSTGLLGSVNAVQIGTGSRVSQVALDFQQGNLESTGKPLDLAVDGTGFFVAKSGANTYFTRSGAFSLDEHGYLTDPATGNLVQRFGTVGDPDGINPSFQTPGDDRIYIPKGAAIAGKASQTLKLAGNLSSTAKGPVVQKLTTATAFLAGGLPATLSTTLNQLDSTTPPYVNTDKIEIGGQKSNGSAPNLSQLTLDPSTATLGDLIAELNTAYSGATVTLGADGKIVAQDDIAGPSMLNIVINDNQNNVGWGGFDTHKFVKNDLGKAGDRVNRTIELYDASGAARSVGMAFTKQADGTWAMKVTLAPGDGVVIDDEVHGIAFLDDGTFAQAGSSGLGDTNMAFHFEGQISSQSLEVSFGSPGTIDGMSQLGTPSSLAYNQDGFAPGELTDVHIDTDGTVFGLASNGLQIPMAQLAVASFRNENGLLSVGNNNYLASLSSGDPEIGSSLSGSRGAIRSGQLEGSNVDLALEFTRLIVAQRGFSANARTITVTDRVLEELTNIIR